MGAFAVIKLPLILSKRAGAPAIAQDVVAAFPGTRNVEIGASGATVLFELHFPGNLSGLIRRLNDSHIGVGESAQVSIPVASLLPGPGASEADSAERLTHGAEVWDPQFTRGAYVLDARLVAGRVEATILCSSAAMHQLYDSMLTLGLVASEAPQPIAGVL